MSNLETGNDHRDAADGRYVAKQFSDDVAPLSAAPDTFNDDAAVREMLETAKHLTPVDAQRISESLADTSWGVRYRLSTLTEDGEVDTLVHQARDAMQHLDGSIPEEQRACAEVAVTDALVAANNFRRLGAEEGWGVDEYVQMTAPWHGAVGTAHPDEQDLPQAELDRARAEAENPDYADYDSLLGRMDEQDAAQGQRAEDMVFTPAPDTAVFFSPGPVPF